VVYQLQQEKNRTRFECPGVPPTCFYRAMHVMQIAVLLS